MMETDEEGRIPCVYCERYRIGLDWYMHPNPPAIEMEDGSWVCGPECAICLIIELFTEGSE